MNARVEQPARRGRPPKLDREQVIETALAILETEGLEAMSFRRICRDLDASHQTLYNYFENRDALLSELVARTLHVPSVDPEPGRPWDEHLRDAIRDMRTALLARPAIAQAVSAQHFGGESDEVRAALESIIAPAGLSKEVGVHAIASCFELMLGNVMVESQRSDVPHSFDFGLDALIEGIRRRSDSQRHP